MDYDVITTDYNYKNHIAKANGIFKFYKPIKFKFLPVSINNNKENLILLFPNYSRKCLRQNNGWTSTL